MKKVTFNLKLFIKIWLPQIDAHVEVYHAITALHSFKGIRLGKIVKMIKFLFFAQKVSSGMGALRPKFLGG